LAARLATTTLTLHRQARRLAAHDGLTVRCANPHRRPRPRNTPIDRPHGQPPARGSLGRPRAAAIPHRLAPATRWRTGAPVVGDLSCVLSRWRDAGLANHGRNRPTGLAPFVDTGSVAK
jgi:hypothetical protein